MQMFCIVCVFLVISFLDFMYCPVLQIKHISKTQLFYPWAKNMVNTYSWGTIGKVVFNS